MLSGQLLFTSLNTKLKALDEKAFENDKDKFLKLLCEAIVAHIQQNAQVSTTVTTAVSTPAGPGTGVGTGTGAIL